MTKQTAGRSSDSSRYEIRLGGHLEPRWAAWFDGMALIQQSDGTTVIQGPVIDQATLHGLLQRVRDLGLPLLGVTQLDPDQPHTSSNSSHPSRKDKP
ncbi:hypothetical protein [Geodermatophilus sp. SYSU D01176]